MAEKSPGQRFWEACAKAFDYSRTWEVGTPLQHRQYEKAAKLFSASDPKFAAFKEALEAIADGEGCPVEIARQTLASAGTGEVP